MKQILTRLTVISMIGLAGCSSNTKTENTTIGGVTGAAIGGLAGSAIGAGTGRDIAIGVGIIAGALIGGTIGHNMDSTDHATTAQAIKHNPTRKTTSWVNERTGIAYTMTPVSGFITIKGNPNCREFHFTATQHGKTRAFDGAACQMADGKWYRI